MASYAPLPAYVNPANAMVNFQPVSDALDSYQKGMTVAGESTAKINAANAMAAGDNQKAMGELMKVDPRAAMEAGLYGLKKTEKEQEVEQNYRSLIGAHAQTLSEMKDPAERAASLGRWITNEPKVASGLQKMGIDWKANPDLAIKSIYQDALKAQDPEAQKKIEAETFKLNAEGRLANAQADLGSKTTDAQNYAMYVNQEKAANRAPKTFENYLLDNRKAGAINIVNSGETTQSQELGKDRAKREIGIRDSAEKAYDELNAVNIMRQMMRNPNFYSGVGAEEFALPFKQAIAAIGGDPTAAASMEVFRSQANKSVLQDIGGSLGVGISNADRSFIERQVATLGNSPAGNSALIDIKEKLARRKIEVGQFQEDYILKHGKIDQQFQTDLRKWRDEHPMFTDREMGTPAPGTPRPTQTQRPASPQPQQGPQGQGQEIPEGQPGSRSRPAYAPTPDAARALPSGVWFTVPGETEPRRRN